MSDTRPIVAVAVAADADPSPWVDALAPLLPDFAVSPLPQVDPLRVRYVAAWNHEPGAMAPCRNLRAIFSLGAGVDHLLADPALPTTVLIGRVVDPDLTARMGEWVCLQVLMHHRQQRRYESQQAARRWADDPDQPAAHEVRVGVMGLGEMGRDALRKLRVLGFNVAGWSRSPRMLPDALLFAGEAGLEPFLRRTQILVVLLPLTAATRGLLARPLFETLARDGHLGGPALINAGRGGLQNEADILSCLADGTLAAAALDVFETEPLPTGSPLWCHPAVTITPHNAAVSSPAAVSRFLVGQIAALEAGETLPHVVDRARGY